MKAHVLLPALAFAVTLGGCGGLKVQSDYDPEADFSGWQTYQWAERTPTGKEDGRVYNDITASRVKSAVNKTLQGKGFREVTSGDSDFLVAWHGVIEGKVSVNTVNTHYGYGWGWYGGIGTSQTYVNQWNEGTLVIDIVDPNKNRLVWRGSGTDTIEEDRSSPERMQQRFDDGVAKIMATFPPGNRQSD